MICTALALTALALTQDAKPQAAIRARLQEWSDALALDRPHEVLQSFKSVRTGRDGVPLIEDGRALAVAARAALIAEGNGAQAALAILDSGRLVTPETASYVELERVHIAIEAGEFERALALVLWMPDAKEPRWPTLPHSWYEAGRAFVLKGETARGAQFLSRFVDLAPHDRETSAALKMLAREAFDRGDGAMARRCFERAEQVDQWHALWRTRTIQARENPHEPLPHVGLADLWLQIDDVERARTLLQWLLPRHLDFAPAWFLLGECDRKRSDMKAASFSYGRALELEPNHVLARIGRAIIALREGRLAEARADLERLVDGPVSTDPLALGAHLELTRLLERLGENEAAAKRYARYVELGGKEPRKP